MRLDFTKMHGLGNDMIVINSLDTGFVPSSEQASSMCRRRLGIGADQVLVLLPSDKADFQMRIRNADGSEVEMCGNGIRCLAKYIHDRAISEKGPIEIETLAGIIRPEIMGELVRVDMGEPVFDPHKVPVKADSKVKQEPIRAGDHELAMSALSMGNPHCVIEVDRVDQAPLLELGPLLEKHELFPNRTNVELVEVLSPGHIKLRVWERGAGATMACGTGACAAAVAMMDLGLAERKVTASLPGGDLEIEWDEKDGRVWMTGPAQEVFSGHLDI